MKIFRFAATVAAALPFAGVASPSSAVSAG